MAKNSEKSFRWTKGRQATNYEKMLICRCLFFDIYILYFPTHSSIPPHVDPVDGKNHYRINVVLKKAKTGGEFYCDRPIIKTKRLNFFRSDIAEHGVSEITEGTRYVLSIGLAFPKRGMAG